MTEAVAPEPTPEQAALFARVRRLMLIAGLSWFVYHYVREKVSAHGNQVLAPQTSATCLGTVGCSDPEMPDDAA